jgi:hypothetical protein
MACDANGLDEALQMIQAKQERRRVPLNPVLLLRSYEISGMQAFCSAYSPYQDHHTFAAGAISASYFAR